jgi:hypothetical protein
MTNRMSHLVRSRVVLFGVAALVLPAALSTPASAANANPVDGWVSLFNGEDLSGWDGAPGLWSVQDGAIHGQTTKENPIKSNTFLVYRGGTFDDFELRVKFRLLGGNSGVQYRSKEFDQWRIAGYQADILDTLGMVGFLYEEGGRAFLANLGEFVVVGPGGKRNVIGSVCDKQALIDAGYYQVKDWNEYRIICRANHIVQYLNGYKTIELLDNDRLTNPADPKDRRGASRTGLIALQLHAGPPMAVDFKDIRIRRFTPPCADAVLAFNGRNLDEWTTNAGSGKANKWVVGKAKVSAADPKQLERVDGTGELINLTPAHGASQDIYSKAKFGDCRIELEVMVPQGSNSGIYVMGEYEIQVLDSYGKQKVGSGDMGAIYGGFAPPVNASKKPGEWQQYAIEWQAPKFDAAGKKTENARFLKIELNGQLLHQDLVMPGATPGGVTGHEVPLGPLMFQGNHGPVAYRNIVVEPLK